MKVDLLIAEIGSTTTVVNAFNIKSPKFIGQGQSPTTVIEGDVNIGLANAIEDLCKNLDVDSIIYDELMATSSAAGGLRMTVHGLVYDMTVKAAKEAALGAGANIELVTAGKLRQSDLRKIKEIKPNIILIAGGVDYGERDTALYNCQLIARLNLKIPIIYGGNIENHEDVDNIFKNSKNELHIVDNVYPKIDELNVEPTRKVIQDVFERHIVHGAGMERIRDMVKGPIMPTPGAVMEASKVLYEDIGDLLTIDVGGATTDIHSVCKESEEISRILVSPEPTAKRTVEGDLGVYISMDNLIEIIGQDIVCQGLNISLGELERIRFSYRYIPKQDDEIDLIKILTFYSAKLALYRHVGLLKDLYGPKGKKVLAEGKDLTEVKYLIATGGALTQIPGGDTSLRKILENPKGRYLLPSKNTTILLDEKYIMASLGVLSKKYPLEAIKLMRINLTI